MLLFDGRALWFHSMNSEGQVLALYDYVSGMLDAQRHLPVPTDLVEYHFSGFNWEDAAREPHLSPPPPGRLVEPSGFLFLSQSDTDILALTQAVRALPADFPRVQAHNLNSLKSDVDVDAFLSMALPEAEVVVLRLIGGLASFQHGVDRILAHVNAEDKWLVCIPGTDTLDPELTAISNAGVPVTHETLAYLQQGGVGNYEHALRFLSDHLLMSGVGYDQPQPQPRHGVYHADVPEGSLPAWRERRRRLDWERRPTLGVLFYRAHLLSGNTHFIDAIVRQGEARGLNILPVYAYSLKEYPEGMGEGQGLPAALRYFVDDGTATIDALVCTMSFAMGGAGGEDGHWSSAALEALDIPVLQAITASTSREQWAMSQRGLNPIDTGINVAIPEFDGRIITVPISFKETVLPEHAPGCAAGAPTGGAMVAVGCACSPAGLQTPVTRYQPVADRIERVLGQCERLITLRRKPNGSKRIAFMLTNYAAKASRVANAVGLDSPASLLELLRAMRGAGYTVGELPEDGDALLHELIERGNYDLDVVTEAQLAGAAGHISPERYGRWFGALPAVQQREMAARWDRPPGQYYIDSSGGLALAGVEFGNTLVAIQPPRGYGMDPSLIYHMPDLPPPHPYAALYRWLSQPLGDGGWGADAIVHLGKHGTLEWLPGKGVGVSAECYPDSFLADLPLVYPFIINNPGEGAQAKRRTHAVIIDHLTPPMTTAEGYGELEQLSRLVDEYYQMEKLDPSKLPLLQQQIWSLIRQARLDADLGRLLNWDSAEQHTHEWDPEFHEDGVPYTVSDLSARDFAHLVDNINGYLCELTSAQIRDGLHVLGRPPQGRQLVDTLQALVRLPNLHVPSLRAGVAGAFGVELDVVLEALGERVAASSPALEQAAGRELPTNADLLEAIDAIGLDLIAAVAARGFRSEQISGVMAETLGGTAGHDPLQPGAWATGVASVDATLSFICRELAPNLARTTEEIDQVLRALEGHYIPPGPSGAPTRGMAHVLPTGRNFYTVDPRSIPSEAAWQVGSQLATALLARHLEDEKGYPESVGISIWGTSAMRTHGDDVAEVLALLGVRPRWQPESRRLIGVEVIPLEELGRPRIDVVCRISGFFRDAFPHLIALLEEAFQAVAHLDEPDGLNFIRKHFAADSERLTAGGAPPAEAARTAGYRIFGSKPGSYGAGILPLIDAGNWQDSPDFAEAYVNWGGYAYTAEDYGVDARVAFQQVLSGVEVAVKNQDNREHDIFDSDDYLQYHGGMIATIRALTGKNPRRYFGDSADPQRAKVRDLKEEALRVFRSRVVNPKWIASVQRHGYKGALELAATVDYVFGYDATAQVMEDWMYARLAESYVLDPTMQEFLAKSNPWALKDMAGRLLEAIDRGLWHDPGGLADSLRQTFLDAEAGLEGRPEPAALARPV
ncbi:MAG: cobaltochelatase subunit CobN [Dehalococcoidia bacterium]|nr:cobaltochelatase subunit CobN [Dehalococcoidia bacterium]